MTGASEEVSLSAIAFAALDPSLSRPSLGPSLWAKNTSRRSLFGAREASASAEPCGAGTSSESEQETKSTEAKSPAATRRLVEDCVVSMGPIAYRGCLLRIAVGLIPTGR